jgi:hypothetical protein
MPPPIVAITATLAAAKNLRFSLHAPAKPAPPLKPSEAVSTFVLFILIPAP